MMETVACHSCSAYAWAGPKRSGPKSRSSPGDRQGLLFLAPGYDGLKGKPRSVGALGQRSDCACGWIIQ
ncbi:MAG: hypothetical protein DMG05_22380 [Acidobacteria bacterium]|nr:MAG: hypothetical protein DMG05_22380 [Acidobacteriota bacterium]